jgi:hypothetical protein
MSMDIFPADQHSGGVSDLAVQRPEHTEEGAAVHHLQPVLDQLQRQWRVGRRGVHAPSRIAINCETRALCAMQQQLT